MTLNCAERDLVSNVFRKGMQNPSLLLRHEEGGVLTKLEDLSCINEQHNYNPTAVNVEKSEDVIIGPVTQFHGPVTIYHNINGVSKKNGAADENKTITQNGKLVEFESTSSGSSPFYVLHSRRLTYIGAIVISVIIVVVLCATLLSTHKKKISLTVISRTEWGAQTTDYNKPLKHPTSLVIMCHTTGDTCESFAQCKNKVLNIQRDQINRGYDDISYNFLIGGDSNAYVGRGWDKTNVISTDSFSIAFIGDFVFNYLTEGMVTMVKTLIEDGVKNGKLSKDYKIVCQNQTSKTVSPGRHVYEVVKTWPEFDPSSYLNNKS